MKTKLSFLRLLLFVSFLLFFTKAATDTSTPSVGVAPTGWINTVGSSDVVSVFTSNIWEHISVASNAVSLSYEAGTTAPPLSATTLTNVSPTTTEDLDALQTGSISSRSRTLVWNTDTDGDGTPDATDLDDDNDGIPDTIENTVGCVSLPAINGPTGASFTTSPGFFTSGQEHILNSLTVGSTTYPTSTLEGATCTTTSGTNTFIFGLPTAPATINDAISGLTISNGVANITLTEYSFSTAIVSDEKSIFFGEINGGDACTIIPLDTNGDPIGTWTLAVGSGDYGASQGSMTVAKSTGGTQALTPFITVFSLSDFTGGTGTLTNVAGIRVNTVGIDPIVVGTINLINVVTAGCLDIDGDGIINSLDLDSDNDGILDVDEGGNGTLDTNGDGVIDSNDSGFLDTNTDGQADGSVDTNEAPDTDGDGVPDLFDLDSDNDGILDIVENGNGALDTNGDGFIDSNDTNGGDADTDGIPDSVDTDDANFGEGAGGEPDNTDSDSDGVPNHRDLDSDDDGVNDIIEGGNTDTDGNGLVDGADSDNDGIKDDVDEDDANFGDAGNTDTNATDPTDPNSGGTGVVTDSGTDADGDGIADSEDSDDAHFGDALIPCNAGTTAPPLSDTILMNVCPATTANLDALHIGTTPAFTTLVWSTDDDSSDGLASTVATPTAVATAGTYYAYYYDASPNNCYSPVSAGVVYTVVDCTDTDGDGILNTTDVDDDNDGIPDTIENTIGCAYLPAIDGPTGASFTTSPGFFTSGQEHILNSLTVGSTTYAASTLEGATCTTTSGSHGFTFGLPTAPNSINDALSGLTISNGVANIEQTEYSFSTAIVSDEKSIFFGDINGPETCTITPLDTNGNPIGTWTLAVGSGDYGASQGTMTVSRSNGGTQDLTPFITVFSLSDFTGGTGTLTDVAGIRVTKIDIDPIVVGTINLLKMTTSCLNMDIDGDGIINSLDLDSDNDGILDVDEGGNGTLDTNGDGVIDSNDSGFLDTNTDGQADGSVDTNEAPDTDGDGVSDLFDLDSDNDGILDIVENGNGALDTNGDGFIDSNDTNGGDADTDGIPDSVDTDDANFGEGAGGEPDNTDSDSDGVPDHRDLDSDDDGVNDIIEGGNTDTGFNGLVDGADSDNDGIKDDVDEDDANFGDAGNTDTNATDPTDPNSGGTGVVTDSGTDADGDGIADSEDSDDVNFGEALDTDGDGIADTVDVDDDNDGILDIDECLPPDNLLTNGDFANSSNWIESHNTFSMTGPINFTSFNSPLTGGNYQGTNRNGAFFSALDNDGDFDDATSNQHLNLINTTSVTLNNGLEYIFSFDIREFTTSSDKAGALSWVIIDETTNEVLYTIPNTGMETNGVDKLGILPLITPAWQTVNSSFVSNLPTGTYRVGMTWDVYLDPTPSTTVGVDFFLDRIHLSGTVISCDTDNDGIPNHLDLDSDGDGCPDALEAGVPTTAGLQAADVTNGNGTDDTQNTTTNIAGSQLDPNGTDNNNDGLNDSVDTAQDGTPDYTSTFNPNGLDPNISTACATDEAMITQVYHYGTHKAIEVTNISATETVLANTLKLSLFNSLGDKTGIAPTETYTIQGALLPGQSALITSTGFTGATSIQTPVQETNANITGFDGADDILILSRTTDATAWANRIDVIESFTDNTSYVRIDETTALNTTYTASEWVAFVDDNLDPYRAASSGGPERHPHDPLLSEVDTPNSEANNGLGLHRIGETVRTGNAWSNGEPDRSRRVSIDEDYAHTGSNLSARQLTLVNDSKLSITDNALIVTEQITLTATNDEVRLIGTSQLITTHTNVTQIIGNGKLYVDQNSEVPSLYRYNYFSSPVNSSGLVTYTVSDVVKDGTSPTSESSTPLDINFIGGYNGNFENSPAQAIELAEHWIYTYGANETWEQKFNGGTIPETDGFIFKGPGRTQNYTFVGTPKDGTMQTTIAADAPYLIGNPFASAIRSQKFIEDNLASTTGTLYFWEQHESANGEVDTSGHNFGGYIGGYAIRNISMGLAANNPANEVNDGNGIAGLGQGSYTQPAEYIAIGQGFFVAGSGTGGTIEFNNTQREFIPEGAQSIFFRNTEPTKTITSTLPILKLGMDYINDDQQALHRQIGISFLQGNSFGFENGYDSPAFDLGATDFYWDFPADDAPYVISGVQEISESLEVPLTIVTNYTGDFVITIDEWANIDREVYIIDKVDGITYLLNDGPITLNLPAGDYKDRFYLAFGATILSTEDNVFFSNAKIYADQSSSEIVIESKGDFTLKKVELYDVIGKRIKRWKELQNQNGQESARLKVERRRIGIYLLRVFTDKGTINKKVYLNFN